MTKTIYKQIDSTTTETSQATVEADRPADPTIGIDEIFEILKNQRRRYVIRYLDETEAPVTLSDLAEHIAAWENDKELAQITSQERKRVYVGLYQCHLPKMDDVGAIAFNKPRGIIDAGEDIDLFRQYLPADEEEEETEATEVRYHWAMSVVTAALLGLLVPLEMLTSLQLLQPGVIVILGALLVVSLLAFARR